MKTNTRKGVYKTESTAGVKEYKPSKSFSFSTVDDTFDRSLWRDQKIQTILNANANLFYKDFSHLMQVNDGVASWLPEKVNEIREDDVTLNFICNIINNYK